MFEWVQDHDWSRADARNRGILVDCQVRSQAGHHLRLVMYQEPLTGKVYEFLTNAADLPPGVVAELYRRRWEAEKVFDEIKNKLGQKKAWATSLVAKETQALLIALTHNLLLCYEQALAGRHQLDNEAEDHRRNQRLQSARRTGRKTGWPLPALLLEARRATQHSVKFIRWLRHALREKLAEAVAVPRLRQLYATL